MLRGWALAEQGQGEEGIAQIRQGLTAYRATGAELMRSYFLALLAEACGKAEQAKEGLAALAEALTVVDKSGERFYEAELYRLKGELLLVQEGHKKKSEDGEQCFLQAMEVARHQ
jgi:predicted ATPase